MRRSQPLRQRTPLKRSSEISRRRSQPKGLKQAKAWVRDRSRGRCEARIEGVCTGRGEHVHHLRLRSQGGDDTVGNLVDTCFSCHRYIHDHPAWAYEHGWLRRREA